MKLHIRVFLLAALACLMIGCGKTGNEAARESELEVQITDAVISNMKVLNDSTALYRQALESSKSYLSGSIDEEEWLDNLENSASSIAEMESIPLNEELTEKIKDSDFSYSEFSTLAGVVDEYVQEYYENLIYLGNLLYADDEENIWYYNQIVEIYDESCVEELTGFWYATNDVLATMTGTDAINSFIQNAQELSQFKNIATDWADTSEEAVRLQEAHQLQAARLIDEHSIITAKMQGDLNDMKADIIRMLMDDFDMSEEDALEYIQKIEHVDSAEFSQIQREFLKQQEE